MKNTKPRRIDQKAAQAFIAAFREPRHTHVQLKELKELSRLIPKIKNQDDRLTYARFIVRWSGLNTSVEARGQKLWAESVSILATQDPDAARKEVSYAIKVAGLDGKQLKLTTEIEREAKISAFRQAMKLDSFPL